MVTLQDALKDKNTIIELADNFGFENVRVYCDPASPLFQLVVSRKKDAKDYCVALEAYLIERLNLQIVIVQENKLKALYKKSTLQQSVPIDDTQAIERLYQKKLSDVMLEEAPNDPESKEERESVLYLANRVLDEINKPDFSTSRAIFFSEAPEAKTSSSVADPAQLKRKVDELTKEVDTSFVAVLKCLPQEVLDKVDNHVREIKKSRINDAESPASLRRPIKGI